MPSGAAKVQVSRPSVDSLLMVFAERDRRVLSCWLVRLLGEPSTTSTEETTTLTVLVRSRS